MKKHFLKLLISDLLLGLGAILVISPFTLYWFIHGSHQRYLWIISGPYPFSHLGGGPFQLFIYSALFLMGIFLITVSNVFRRKFKFVIIKELPV